MTIHMRVTPLAYMGFACDNGATTKDDPGPAALTAGGSQGLARRYEGAPN